LIIADASAAAAAFQRGRDNLAAVRPPTAPKKPKGPGSYVGVYWTREISSVGFFANASRSTHLGLFHVEGYLASMQVFASCN